jgi:hypothetical protein
MQEAWEEAGLMGVLHSDPLGTYLYRKSGKVHLVTVFFLNVTRVAEHWPESRWRRRFWLTPAKARVFVAEWGLRELIRTGSAAIVGSSAGVGLA